MSARIHTHYDNLKVAPDASAAVIRAAYRALSQQHHPDRNPDNPDAHHIMSVINQSYAVLSDPQQRRAHDAWIAAQQRRAPPPALLERQHGQTTHPTRPPRPGARVWGQWLGMAALVLLLVGGWWGWQNDAPSNNALSTAAPAAAGLAPNGQALPSRKDYVAGYPLLRQRGGNVVRVDNGGLNSGVFAQLYELRNGKLTAIRSFYIPAGDSFAVGQVGDGDFSLHYRRVDNGTWQISAPWQIERTETSGQYRQIDVKL